MTALEIELRRLCRRHPDGHVREVCGQAAIALSESIGAIRSARQYLKGVLWNGKGKAIETLKEAEEKLSATPPERT